LGSEEKRDVTQVKPDEDNGNAKEIQQDQENELEKKSRGIKSCV
jgi:hypothetical protein